MKHRKGSFRMRDWEEEFKRTINDGTGFLIDTSIDYKEKLNSSSVSEIKKIFETDGIYSYKFGMSSQIEGDSPLLKKLYTCKCHHTFGIENVDNICPRCNTIVRRSIPYRMGWIDLVDYKILHPFICELLWTTYRKVSISKTGKIDISDENDLQENTFVKVANDKFLLADLLKSGKLKYTWKDILYGGKIEDFLREYFSNSKNVWFLLNMLRGKYFTSKIEVLSAEYRPMKIQEIVNLPEITQHFYNVKYMDISEVTKLLLLNKKNLLISQKVNHLVSIMKNVADIAINAKIELGGGKKATLRADNYSRRMKNAARLIIEPIIDRDKNEIDTVGLPVDVFRSIMRKDVLHLLNDYPDIDGEMRQRLIDHDVVLTDEEKNFIKYEIFPKVVNPYIYINREPCIYTTSALGMKVYLTEDRQTDFGRELVMRVPFHILPAIAGDFDGDEMSIISWDNPRERQRIYETLSPKSHIVDSMNATYNADIGPNNNTAVLLYKGFYKDPIIEKLK